MCNRNLREPLRLLALTERLLLGVGLGSLPHQKVEGV